MEKLTECLIIDMNGERYRIVPEKIYKEITRSLEKVVLDKNKPISEQIQILRKNKGLSQKDLAEKSGLTAVQICRIETGSVKPHRSSVNSILYALASSS